MGNFTQTLDWTLNDNIVDGLFFCATLTSYRGAIPHLCKHERKRPKTLSCSTAT